MENAITQDEDTYSLLGEVEVGPNPRSKSQVYQTQEEHWKEAVNSIMQNGLLSKPIMMQKGEEFPKFKLGEVHLGAANRVLLNLKGTSTIGLPLGGSGSNTTLNAFDADFTTEAEDFFKFEKKKTALPD